MRTKILLFGIILIAFVLRTLDLGNNPPHLTPDEASLGYNAFSILKTAKDEYREFLPIIFKSFGDYKPGFYVYLTVPFIMLFGLTEFAVRLPSALAGVFAVWLTYEIIKEITNRYSLKLGNGKIGLVSAFLLSVSPWHIYYSRGAWEANIALTFVLLGVLLFIKSFKKPELLPFSAISFALTFITYQGAKLSTPLVLLPLFLAFRDDIKRFSLKTIGFSAVVGILFALPIMLSLFTGKAGRLEVFSVFSYPRPHEYLQNILQEGDEKVGNLNYYLLHSEAVSLTRGVIGRWFNHFSGSFLFFEGDYQNPKHQVPHNGQLLLIMFIPLVFGIGVGIKQKNALSIFLLAWLLLAPLPAALSRDQVQATRALNMVIPLTVLSAIGIVAAIEYLKKSKTGALITVLFALLFTANLIYFFDGYFVHLPKHNAKHWHWGYREVVLHLKTLNENYDKIIVEQSYSQPYIYFLFYQQVNPSDHQKEAFLVENSVDVGLVESLKNIEFRKISWPPAVFPSEKALIIGSTVSIPDYYSDGNFSLVKEFTYPTGEISLRMIEYKDD